MKAIHEGLATDDATAILLADLDARLVALDDAHADPPEALPPSGAEGNHQIG